MGLPDGDLGIPPERLAATTYTTDDLASGVWRDEIGLPPERLVRWGDFPNGDEKNWWRMADVGPCGPCSEIHFDRGAYLSEGPGASPTTARRARAGSRSGTSCSWNSTSRPTGASRRCRPRASIPAWASNSLASVVQQVPTNYDTDLFTPIHARMRELLGHDPDAFEQERFSYQVIADHSRAVTFLIADDVLPSNEGRGYVLRRILRRAVRHGRLLGRREPFMADTASVVDDVMAEGLSLPRREARPYPEHHRARGAVRAHARCGHGIEEALIPLTSAEPVVGRRPEDPASRCPAGAQRRRLPPP